MTARDRELGMSERELDDAIYALAAGIDKTPRAVLLAYHTRDSRRSLPGFPDWCFAGARGIMFRECKTQRGHLRLEQSRWLQVLRQAGADADVWRPADLLDGRIANELLHLSGLRPVVDLTGKLSPAAERLIDRIMEDE